ncbi:RagB/SusD family nutrient uptake outer membrane protein [Chitinophaga agrisoli]|uniref:RagB/SusD family nutrient uptake outer membrane protein n=1 Tax=Chitinophaga agrisoli TaxID=2607653 RepID=A0A5B2VRD3_9BACT|nr:RagB/SusD family nutrient uptake outer membrane protein [Chitinophaga agrisoli]KAA2240792.1 RagB/SusD family nutrient uptake outer membrane protein [Chitinophaga agrisoli]
MKWKYTYCLVILLLTGCRDYLEIPLPANQVAGSGAYDSDRSCAAVMNGIYSQLMSGQMMDGAGVGYRAGLYTDELQDLGLSPIFDVDELALYANNVQPGNTDNPWEQLYFRIYTCNLAIEGITANNTGALHFKDQWLGEAYFMRAFLHFYLAALYGDAVVATTSDYTVINTIPRSPVNEVYQQVIKDLQQAQQLLSVEYKDGKGTVTLNRGRPNKAAAAALLARVYLYTGNWAGAAAQATTLIENAAFQLVPPAQTFLTASPETIWSLAPDMAAIVDDYSVYYNDIPDVVTSFPASNVFVAMSDSLAAAFEPGDARKTEWAKTVSSNTLTYVFPSKYKSKTPGEEYLVLFRLAEQYLIRAEARAQLGQVTGANSAQQDIDVVRARAALPGTTAATQSAMLTAIDHERRVELFAEAGHRLFDLRRRNTLNTIMTIITPQKGGRGWQPYMQWWPIPVEDLKANPSLKQTTGY